jgi:DNA-binding transcriptional LysR family regulator
LKQLRYVEAAGRLGSIARAAGELNISQSSITVAIDALESSLDFDVFLRTPSKGIRATPAGMETLQLIRNFIDQSHHFESEIQTVGSEAAGLVRIAVYVTAAPTFLPPILQEISSVFPGISIRLMEGHMGRVLDFMSGGEADLAFAFAEAIDDRYNFAPLFKAPTYALISKADPLSQKQGVTLLELSKRPMVLLDLPLARDLYVGLFREKGLDCHVAHTSRSAEICRTLVSSGYGFSILNILPPDYSERSWPYRAIPISDAGFSPTFGIATNAGVRQPKTVRVFIESCLLLREAGAFDAMTVEPPYAISTKK